MAKFARKKCRGKSVFFEAIFFALEKSFFQIFCTKFLSLPHMISLAEKFLKLFLQIIIQNHDVKLALVLHFLHKCYT